MGARVPASHAPAGLRDALRAIGRTLNEVLRIRGALLAVEFREEVERRKGRLILGALAFGFLHSALLMVTLLVVVIFWDTHRIAAVATMAAIYLACGLAALIQLRMETAASPAPFAGTLGELEQDLDAAREPS